MLNIIPSCLGIIAVTIIECMAIHKGVDGQILAITLALIGGLAGYKVKGVIENAKKKK